LGRAGRKEEGCFGSHLRAGHHQAPAIEAAGANISPVPPVGPCFLSSFSSEWKGVTFSLGILKGQAESNILGLGVRVGGIDLALTQ